MAKMAEATSHQTYRDRARQDYEERRADGRLVPAQRTCATLDEKSGKTVRFFLSHNNFVSVENLEIDFFESVWQFNVLWLNPQNPDAFPEGLMAAITDRSFGTLSNQIGHADESAQSRLRRQMQADALRPVTSGLGEDDSEESHQVKEIFTPETIEEAIQFLRLNVRVSSLHICSSKQFW